MQFDKNYFLDQLRNGASMDNIGQALADAMNEAQEAYNAELDAKKKAAEVAALTQNKREMALDLIHLIQDYGMMVAPEAADVLSNYDEDDIDMMVNTLDEMFNMMSAIAKLKVDLDKCSTITPCSKAPKSDDEVLSNFIKSLM